MTYRYYVIRHKATNELMPEMKRGRGYTHWNPSIVSDKDKTVYELPTPRLIDTRRRAARIIIQWSVNPNAYRGISTNYYGEQDDIIDIKPDGRTKDDLEIVEADLILKSNE